MPRASNPASRRAAGCRGQGKTRPKPRASLYRGGTESLRTDAGACRRRLGRLRGRHRLLAMAALRPYGPTIPSLPPAKRERDGNAGRKAGRVRSTDRQRTTEHPCRVPRSARATALAEIAGAPNSARATALARHAVQQQGNARKPVVSQAKPSTSLREERVRASCIKLTASQAAPP